MAGPHTISTLDEQKFADCYGYDMETTLAATDAEIAGLIALIIFKSCHQWDRDDRWTFSTILAILWKPGLKGQES